MKALQLPLPRWGRWGYVIGSLWVWLMLLLLLQCPAHVQSFTAAAATTSRNQYPRYLAPVFDSNSNNNNDNINNRNIERDNPILAEEVWVQLYIEGIGKSGDPFSIDFQSLPKKRIQEMTRAVLKECEDDLRGLRYSKLSVYTAGTEFPPKQQDKLEPDMPLPDDTTAKNPLRVVAPAIEKQQGPARKTASKKKKLLKSMDGKKFAPPLEVVVPQWIEDNPPKFTAGPNWLNDTCDMILSRMDKQDTGFERVPPLCLARCSRGGKSRALYEVAKRLKELSPGTAVIYVSFNDYSRLDEEEQKDPVTALCKRIAFAALKGRNFQKSIKQYQAHIEKPTISMGGVKKWLGDTPCVLLIDELNLVNDLGSTRSKKKRLPALALSKLLKSMFLEDVGRYFVFSSHVVTTKYQLADYLETMSLRSVIIKRLPLISSLSTAVENLSSTLTARKAIFCSLVPALVYTSERGVFPPEKRDNIVKQWIKENKKIISNDTIATLLATMFNGNKDHVPEPLMQFMEVTENALVQWIPLHMVFILDAICQAKDLKISIEMRRSLGRVPKLFEVFKDAKEESGDGWESLFVLTLLVRALAGEHHELMGITTIEAGTQVKYDEPYHSTSGLSIHQEKNLTKFLANVPEEVERGPQLSLYYPQHASFQSYDCFLVAWDAKGQRSHITGYQLKEGKAMPDPKPSPKDEAIESLTKRYWIRGEAAQKEQNVAGWLVPTKEHLNEFFGVSGKEWTPEKWKILLSQPSE